MDERFPDRTAAGRQLADALSGHAGDPGVLVLALPRGGVPVGFEVARALGAPLDVFVVRKLGFPGQPELAMGALASGDIVVMTEEVLGRASVPDETVARIVAEEGRELERRERAYRGDRPPLDVRGKTVIVVDDGLATGASMRAAARALRQMEPGRLIIAVPVAPSSTCDALRQEADEVVCLLTPEPFMSVGLWYRDFEQTTDAEVRELLERSEAPG